MNQSRFVFPVLAVLLVAAICILPAYALAPVSDTAAAPAETKPFVSATVSSPFVSAGTPVTISGISVGPGSSVQVWVFAGNYVNVSTVSVNADGTFAKTFNTASLPAATYYVVVQNPGSDNTLSVTTSGFSGTVIDTKTGAAIFNFSGTGSFQDTAAVTALTTAFNARGADDIYTKTQFSITSAAAMTTEALPGGDRDAHGCIGSAGYSWCEAKQKCLREWEESCTAPAAPTTKKSPLPVFLPIAAAAGACLLAVMRK